jgi:large subunit ribosomal protein L22
MEVKATAKRVRLTPRKVRLVLDLIRGKDIKEAQAILKFTPRAASAEIAKVLKSAVANATNNHNLVEDKLYVKACWADEARTLKRWMPRAKGSASQILKRSSHITVVVDEKE